MAKSATRSPASKAPPGADSTQDVAFLTALLGNLPGMAYRQLNEPGWPSEFISDGSLALTGYAPAALMVGGARAFGDIIHPDDREHVWTQVQAGVEARQPYQATYRIETADGTLKWVLDQGVGVYDANDELIALAGFVTDITDRKQAEAELSDSERRLTQALELARMGHWELDIETLMFTFNDQYYAAIHQTTAEEVGGYQVSAEEFARRFVYPDDAYLVEQYTRAALETTDPNYQAQFEVRNLTADGRVIWVSVSMTIDKDAAGRTIRTRGVNLEITARKQAEIELLRLSGAVQQSAEGIAIADLDGNLTYVNQTWAEMHGYTVAELQGKHLSMFHTEQQLKEEVIPFNEKAKQTGSYQGEVGHVRKDGSTFPTLMSSTILTDEFGAPVALVGTARDITEQKEAEESLQMTRASVERSPDAFYWFDTDARFIDVNEATLEMTGYTREEILGLKVFDIDPTFPREAWEPLKAQLKEKGVVTFEGMNQTKDGRRVPVEVVGSHLQFGEQDVYFSIARDITERKAAAEEQARFTRRLNTAAQISEQVGSILDPDELLQTVIPLIKEQFGLYYVHVYTLDEAAGTLNLRAGYGEAGKQMLEHGHSIPLDREASLVATAARTKEPVLVQDVTANPDFMPNPLLPDTKAEVAVPAIAGGKVLGVFDVQHDEKDYFTQADLDVFTTLAAQIANAFHSAELLERAERQRALYDGILTNLPTAVFAVDSQFGLLVTNEAAQKLLGRQMTDKEGNVYVEQYDVVYYATGERFPEGELPLVKANLDGAVHTNNEMAVRHADGTLVPILVNAGPLRDPRGEQMGAVVTFTDMTEQRKAEAAILEREAQTRALLEAVPDMMFRLREDGTFLDFKSESTSELALPPEVFLGKKIGEVLPLDLAELTLKHLQEVVKTGQPVVYEYQIVPMGEQDLHDYEARMVLSGKGEVLSLIRDITERKHARAERERFTQRLNTAAQISEQVGSILDPDELLQTVIPLIKEQFGLYYVHVYTLDEATGTLNLRAGYGEAGKQMLEHGHSIPLDREASLVATAARTKEPVLVQDVTANPDFMPNPLLPDTKAEVAVPAIAGGKVLGVFDVQHDEKDYFTQADLDVFTTLAAQIANAFRSAELFGQTELSLRETEVRLAVSQALTGLETEQAVWAAMLTQSGFYPEAAVGLYAFEDEEGKKIQVTRAFSSFNTDIAEEPIGTRFPADEFEVTAFVSRGDPVITHNIFTDERMGAGMREDARKLGYVSLAATPIMLGNDIAGLIVAHSPREGYFDPAKLHLYAALAEQGAVALQTARFHETIRESQQKFQLVADFTYDWEYWLGPDNTFLYVSPACEKLTGYTVAEFVGNPHLLSEIVITDDETQLHHHIHDYHQDPQNIPSAAEPAETEFRIRTKAGEVRWIGHACQPVYGPDGEWLGRRASNRDITEQKRAEESLQMTRSSVERSPDAFYWFDDDAHFIDVNETTLKMLGYTREEILSLHVFDVDPSFPREAWDPLKAQLKAEGSIAFEGVNQTKDSRAIPVEVVVSYLRFGEQEVYFSIARDITDRKHARAERERFTQRLNTAAQISEQVGAILDPDELLQTVIPLIKEQFGLYYVHVYTLDEAAGTLNLRAGYGEAGAQMLARGHSIPLDREASLVATAARTREPVLVQDVTANLDFMPNPLLPDTKAEVAVPAIAGGKVLGVFDVQHDEKNYFTQADLDVFTTLAAQIANAFHSAELFDEAERQRALYDGILTNLPTAIFAVDSQFGLLVTNEAAQKLLGRQMTDKEGNVYVEQYDVVYYETGERFPEGELPLVKANLDGAVHTNNEMAVRHADGTLVPLLVNAGPLRDPRGQQMGAVVTFTDMTEQRKAEAAVRTNEERLSLALQSGRVGIWEFWPQQNRVYFNPTWYTMLGYAADELPQSLSTWSDLLHPEDAPHASETIQKGVQAGKNFHMQFRMKTKEGNWRWIQARGYVTERVADGSAARIIGTHTDITEQKLAEADSVRFASQLKQAAAITQQVGSILDTDELLRAVVPLLKERFDLYHTHVYLLDEAQGQLVLHTGYGHVGQIMVQQGHKISLDNARSLVARAAREKTVVVSNDVTQDAAFMPNLLLPDTLAEVAVPFMMHDRVLGVFDVQADEVDYFTESYLDVFRTLAGQIANAFRSAQLFEQQRQAEIAQSEAVERIRAIFEAMTEGITVTNTMGQIEDLNEATLRLHIFDAREEVIGRSAMELFARTDWSKASRSIRQALEVGRSTTDEYKMLRKDGRIFDAEMNSALLRDASGNPAGFVSITRDITTRKQAELELQRFATQLNTAADVASQVNSILNPQALLEEVVPLIQERFDLYHVHVYTLDPQTRQLVMRVGTGEAGRKMLAQEHQLSLEQDQGLVARAARQRQAIVVNDVTQEPNFVVNPLLPETRAEVAVPLIAADQLLGVFDVLANEVNRFAKADLDVFTTLAAQISTAFQNAQFFAEIQRTAERLREVDRLKSEFLANMSHELRTPLNSILGYTEVLLMGIDGELSPEMNEDVSAIFENGQYLLQLINDILDLTKIEAGEMTLALEPMDVVPLLDEVKANNAGLLHKLRKTLDFLVEVSEDVPLIRADRVRMSQVLNNLVSNAVKFTDAGAVRMRAYAESPGWVCIEVQDTGIGIAEEDIPKMFERFRQVDGSSTRRAEGTGLGLAITRHLVTMHGGTLTVSSEVDVGSTFTVRLPVYDADAPVVPQKRGLVEDLPI